MKRFLILIICTLCFQIVFAQNDSTKKKDSVTVPQEYVMEIPVKDDKVDYDKEFKAVETEAQFPGGAQAWKKYLMQNLQTDLIEDCYKNIKKKQTIKQTVLVSFLVDKDGKISDVKAENEKQVCPLLAAEAVRVIAKGPNWIPAVQKERNVIYRQRQAISWVYQIE